MLTDRALDGATSATPGARWAARPLPYETSWPGLFAVGDLRSGSTKRVAAAVGEGSAAIRSVHEHLAAPSDGPRTVGGRASYRRHEHEAHPRTTRRRTMPAYFLGRPVQVYVERYARRRRRRRDLPLAA